MPPELPCRHVKAFASLRHTAAPEQYQKIQKSTSMFIFLLHFTSASQPRLPLPSWCRLEILIFNFSTFPSGNVFVSFYGSGSRAKRANVLSDMIKNGLFPVASSVRRMKGECCANGRSFESYKMLKTFSTSTSKTLEKIFRLPFQSLFQSPAKRFVTSQKSQKVLKISFWKFFTKI